jgi:hypothetical protein
VTKILKRRKEEEAAAATIFSKSVKDIVSNGVYEPEKDNDNNLDDFKDEKIPLAGELLPNWKRCFSKSKNKPWYLNTVTQEKRWNVPLYKIVESRTYPGKYYKINPDDPTDRKWL